MSNCQNTGYCPRCGAPYYMPTVWHGTIPPTPMKTCGCFSESVERGYYQNIYGDGLFQPNKEEIERMQEEIDELKEELHSLKKKKDKKKGSKRLLNE